MKKAIKITTGICLVLSVFLLSSCFLSVDASSVGDSQEAMSWYIKRNTAHKQPVLDSKQSDIEKYDAYYLDRSCGGEQGEKILYLTFDAGYENGNIARILDTLREEKVPAAFFVLKHLIKDEPELIRRMAEEGHLVCNHTMNHKDMTCCDRETFVNELRGLEELYSATTGKMLSKYYRPPMGKYSKANLEYAKELGYTTVFWSFAYADWDNDDQPTVDFAKKKILDNIHNGAILLLHPTSATNAEILPEIIRTLKEQGYRFGTLDELVKRCSK